MININKYKFLHSYGNVLFLCFLGIAPAMILKILESPMETWYHYSYLFVLIILKYISYFNNSLGINIITLMIILFVILYSILNGLFFNSSNQILKRSYFTLIIFFVIDALYFYVSIPYGLEWQGTAYTCVFLTLNLVIAMILVFLIILNRKQKKLATYISFHYIQINWIIWCAFPYLGEMGF